MCNLRLMQDAYGNDEVELNEERTVTASVDTINELPKRLVFSKNRVQELLKLLPIDLCLMNNQPKHLFLCKELCLSLTEIWGIK